MAYPFLPVNPCCTDVVINDPCGCSSVITNTGCNSNNPCSTNLTASSTIAYDGIALSCIIAEPCDTLNVILQKIDQIICNLLTQINTLTIQVNNISTQIINIESDVITINNSLDSCCNSTTSTTTTIAIPCQSFLLNNTSVDAVAIIVVDCNTGSQQAIILPPGNTDICVVTGSPLSVPQTVIVTPIGSCSPSTTTTTTIPPSTTTTTTTVAIDCNFTGTANEVPDVTTTTSSTSTSTTTSTTTLEPTTTSTTTLEPTTTTTTTVDPFFYYVANLYACPNCDTPIGIDTIIKSPTPLTIGNWIPWASGGGIYMYNVLSVTSPFYMATLVDAGGASLSCNCPEPTTTTTSSTSTSTSSSTTTTTTTGFPCDCLTFENTDKFSAHTISYTDCINFRVSDVNIIPNEIVQVCGSQAAVSDPSVTIAVGGACVLGVCPEPTTTTTTTVCVKWIYDTTLIEPQSTVVTLEFTECGSGTPISITQPAGDFTQPFDFCSTSAPIIGLGTLLADGPCLPTTTTTTTAVPTTTTTTTSTPSIQCYNTEIYPPIFNPGTFHTVEYLDCFGNPQTVNVPDGGSMVPICASSIISNNANGTTNVIGICIV